MCRVLCFISNFSFRKIDNNFLCVRCKCCIKFFLGGYIKDSGIQIHLIVGGVIDRVDDDIEFALEGKQVTEDVGAVVALHGAVGNGHGVDLGAVLVLDGEGDLVLHLLVGGGEHVVHGHILVGLIACQGLIGDGDVGIGGDIGGIGHGAVEGVERGGNAGDGHLALVLVNIDHAGGIAGQEVDLSKGTGQDLFLLKGLGYRELVHLVERVAALVVAVHGGVVHLDGRHIVGVIGGTLAVLSPEDELVGVTLDQAGGNGGLLVGHGHGLSQSGNLGAVLEHGKLQLVGLQAVADGTAVDVVTQVDGETYRRFTAHSGLHVAGAGRGTQQHRCHSTHE